MAVSLVDILPFEMRPKRKSGAVSNNPTTFRPEHDFKWELEHNRMAHTVHPEQNPGGGVTLYKFPLNLQTLGLNRLEYAIDSRRQIGVGPMISAAVTLGSRHLDGTKPIQILTTLRDQRSNTFLPAQKAAYVEHCLSYTTPPLVSFSKTIRIDGPVPQTIRDDLKYYGQVLGLNMSDTATWMFAIALADQDEIHPDLRADLKRQVDILIEVLLCKAEVVRTMLRMWGKTGDK